MQQAYLTPSRVAESNKEWKREPIASFFYQQF